MIKNSIAIILLVWDIGAMYFAKWLIDEDVFERTGYAVIIVTIITIVLIVGATIFGVYLSDSEERNAHKPLYELLKNDEWDLFFREAEIFSYEKRNEFMKKFEIKQLKSENK